ncbi:uncharacterized protein LOC129928013 isoform X1 [Biomphalaria glabrata]|uniref:Uncharacterized protein LOC129928013 isoform X1 n=1 Tax=Biomphalaria glabrata TaxID=6526 RepID=A0A9W3B8C3_BIOGL|nr:uncharacterized protein LOC129928013 isoform X1 [Biomphalaria glabrata]XP_055895810.1 uncharacterized protein LOC129928013 isoform X1 [Biomphalaria glabrata]XP_055895811.1 uncharacterized protein LOC129928013 isoform X1 [Biomphalaria glabrata]XP_055895812.1 uncharacterized protein LOC129928013 isoform X1 [Biomphalaria glabrata]XP_055895813.1 uncharacterized protein LOC129928013 isoform X1 [Biomphalaria glabrata]
MAALRALEPSWRCYSHINRNSRGYNCLVYAVEASADIPDVSDKLLGQVIKPDQQCQQFFGNDSFFCRVCINGQCVSDPYAPQIDENCAFGDRPSYSCSLFINDFMGNCYSTLGYRACCDTCNNVSRPVKGCEYGDRIIDCTKDHCLNSQVDCCGMCSYGTPFTPTYSTRRSTRLATTVNPLVLFTSIKDCKPGGQDLRPELCTNFSVCLIQPTQCCHYCSSYYTSETTSTTTTRPLIPSTSPKTKCEPGDPDLRPELCTNTSVCQTKSSLCCHYCSLHYNSATTSTTQLTSPNECVLGEPDLSPQLCTSRSICQTQPLMCCKYCSSRDNSASHLSLYTIWIYCFCIAFILYIKTNVY